MHRRDELDDPARRAMQPVAVLGPDGRDTGRTRWVPVPQQAPPRGEALTLFAVALALFGVVAWPVAVFGLPLSLTAWRTTRHRGGGTHGWAFVAAVMSILEIALTAGLAVAWLLPGSRG